MKRPKLTKALLKRWQRGFRLAEEDALAAARRMTLAEKFAVTEELFEFARSCPKLPEEEPGVVAVRARLRVSCRARNR
jgi:hypothetical protein